MIEKIVKRLGLSVILLPVSLLVKAQAADSSATADAVMRSHDKIYVVMAVCLAILVILFLYLIRIDIKVSKKERSV